MAVSLLVTVLLVMSGNWQDVCYIRYCWKNLYGNLYKKNFHRNQGRYRHSWILPFFLLCIALGVGRAQMERRVCERELAIEEELGGDRVVLTGNVKSITQKGNGQELVLDACLVTGENGHRYRLRRILVNTGQDFGKEMISCGNRVRVTGRCKSFDRPRAPGEFDYQTYYRSRKLTYRMKASSVEIKDGRKDWILESLRCLSLHASENLRIAAGEEDAGILRAVLLGDRTDLPDEVRTLYQENGIAHILALSGLHLSLVSMAVYGMLRRAGVGFGCSALMGAVVLTGYAWMSGSSASVVRALIMTLSGFYASYLGRTYDRLSALGLAGIILMWDSPYLLTQAGVQLSFLAIIGIGLFQETDAFHAGIGMHLMSFPAILWHFFQFPLYGIFLNLLVVPFAGILVGSAVCAVVLAECSTKAGVFAAGGARLLLRWYEWCCRITARFPGSHLVIGRPEFWQIGLYYGVIAGILILGKQKQSREKIEKERPRISGMTKIRTGFLIMAGLLLFPLPQRGLHVTFLDVGQGDGICIRSNREVILIDGGSSDEKNFGKNRLVPFLKSSGIRKIDTCIVSHGDLDHISGLFWILEYESDLSIGQLILPQAGRQDEAYQTLVKLASQRGCQVIWLGRGDEIRDGKLRLFCLYPEMDSNSVSDRNEQSLVLRLDYGKFAMMLTGDMSAEGEQAILEKNRKKSEGIQGELDGIFLLKIAHHGSKFSNSEEWLDAMKPEVAVISYGKDNRYGHPHEETMERLRARGIRILETAQDGSIFFHTDGKKISWRIWK